MTGYLLFGLGVVCSVVLVLQESARLRLQPLAPTLWLVLIGVVTTVITETASAFGAVSPRGIRVAWAVVIAVALYRIARQYSRGFGFRQSLSPRPATIVDGPSRLALGAVVFVLIGALACAVLAPPNNYDSMTYHNARVMEWLDHHSVAHYFTTIDRQLRMPPLASFFKLHLYALLGNDGLFNLVQWSFLVASIVQIAAVVWMVTASSAAAIFAMLFAATVPQAVLQASSTQNDLVVAGYLLGAVACGVFLYWRGGPARTVSWLFWASIGLALLVKGTAYFYAPVIVAFVIPVLWNRTMATGRLRVAGASLLLGIVTVAALNAPHLYRNATYAYGSFRFHEVIPPSSWIESPVTLSIKRLGSQVSRQFVLQMDWLKTVGAGPGLGPRLDEGFRRHLGLAQDKVIGEGDYEFRDFTHSPLIHEDYAGNSLHLPLLLVLCAASLSLPRLRGQRLLVAGFACTAALALAEIGTVAFQTYNSRLLLPVFLIGAAPAGAAIAALFEGKRVRFALAGALACSASLYVLANSIRPLIGGEFALAVNGGYIYPLANSPSRYKAAIIDHRVMTNDRSEARSLFQTTRWDDYFRNRPELQQNVVQVIEQVPPTCSTERPAGLVVDRDTWEYALWIGAKRAGRAIAFRHVQPGASGSYCAIIRTNPERLFYVQTDQATEHSGSEWSSLVSLTNEAVTT